MKKRYMAIGVGLGALASYFVVDQNNRNMLVKNIKSIFNKKEQEGSTLEKAGMPDQIDNTERSQVENSKMVSEGSQYGVQYYNRVRDDDDE